MKQHFRLGTRASALARTQSQMIADQLCAAWPGLTVELVFIKTTGDLNRVDPLGTLGGKGVFTREIETALLDSSVDLAVHSLKDLPSELPEGLCLGATPRRADARDALVGPAPLLQLPAGAIVGTGSQRRQAQLRALRSDLEYRDIRGNVPTRIEKWRAGPYTGGVVLAMAGLERLSLVGPDVHALEDEHCLCAPCQGILGLECRRGDEETLKILQALEDPQAAWEALAERAYLTELEGGCNLPAGARARCTDTLSLEAVLQGDDGTLRRMVLQGRPEEAARLGQEAARALKA